MFTLVQRLVETSEEATLDIMAGRMARMSSRSSCNAATELLKLGESAEVLETEEREEANTHRTLLKGKDKDFHVFRVAYRFKAKKVAADREGAEGKEGERSRASPGAWPRRHTLIAVLGACAASSTS